MRIRRKLDSSVSHTVDWREELIRTLISGGVSGVSQGNLHKRLHKWVSPATLQNELQALQDENKVQKFIVPSERDNGGPSTTVWRATTTILKVDKV